MKRKILLKELKRLGFYKIRHGGKHDIWGNGVIKESIPRHNEVNERTALDILKSARKSYERKNELW